MKLRNKFLELKFCICEDESQIDNFVDVAEDFAIGFAEWVNSSKTYYTPMKELLEIYKDEKNNK